VFPEIGKRLANFLFPLDLKFSTEAGLRLLQRARGALWAREARGRVGQYQESSVAKTFLALPFSYNFFFIGIESTSTSNCPQLN
jgi:hypothetical protein